MDSLHQLFLNHLVADGTLRIACRTWISTTETGDADEAVETVRFMALVARAWHEFAAGVDLAEIVLAYRRQVETS